MADIVISEFMDEAAIAAQLAGRDVVYDPKLVDQPERLLSLLGDARALVVRNRTQVRGDLLAAATKLKVVGRLGVGLDNIDMAACRARDIAVFPATGANDVAVAEYVIAAALVLVRGAYAASADVALGKWPRNALIGGEVMGRRLGLVGYGAIARETATRARALGMDVAAFDPHLPAGDPRWAGASRLSLAALLETSDVVSLHVPLTDETRRMIDAAALSRMKKTAILVNAARGGVVDEDALAAALREKRLGGAALDVFEEEPLSAAQGARFAGIPNLILTPHIAGVTDESNVRVSRVTLENVVRALDGR
ncbi:MAG: hydroxyacid dehydrogenase [Parvularculaceae bacterium]|nr:hydroxyacid dehydrogenase [Parvularculaceae bacterium]